MSYKDDVIRINSSKQSLNAKISSHMETGSDLIYWYIKFNIPLMAESVSNKTMRVTDTDGYIMRTDITYNTEKNIIVISPIDTYEQDVFYILTVTKKVSSAKGNKMKSEINILFKLLNNEISEYKILKENVVIPKPKARDKEYYRSKVYSVENKIKRDKAEVSLTPIKINILIGVFGILFMISSLFMNSKEFTIVSIFLSIIGILHIILQIADPKKRATLLYNIGAIAFNSGKYKRADKYFRSAFNLDEQNEIYEYAIEKIKYYISV